DPVAKTGLAQVNLIRRVTSYDQAKARREAAEHPGDVPAQTRVADIDVATGRIEEAFNRLLGVVRRTSGEERDQARAHLVRLFGPRPRKDPEGKRARRALPALFFRGRCRQLEERTPPREARTRALALMFLRSRCSAVTCDIPRPRLIRRGCPSHVALTAW